MGNYEEEYRKYYSDTKAKLNIKLSKKEYDFKNEVMVNLDSSRDIYPKAGQNYECETSLSKEVGNVNYKIEEYENAFNYKPIGTYNGLDNYKNQNSYKRRSGYESPYYYGQGELDKFNGNVKEENLLGKWGNRVIIKLAITVSLFISVIAIKSLPYEEAKAVYSACKEVVSKDFDYKDFIEDIKTINIIEEIDKIKENSNIDEEEYKIDKLKEDEILNDVESFKLEETNENIDEVE